MPVLAIGLLIGLFVVYKIGKRIKDKKLAEKMVEAMKADIEEAKDKITAK